MAFCQKRSLQLPDLNSWAGGCFSHNGTVLVYINHGKEKDCTDTVIHESVHVWQHFLEYTGEDAATTEFEAYTIAYIATTLLKEHKRLVAQKDKYALHEDRPKNREKRSRLQAGEPAVQLTPRTDQSTDGEDNLS